MRPVRWGGILLVGERESMKPLDVVSHQNNMFRVAKTQQRKVCCRSGGFYAPAVDNTYVYTYIYIYWHWPYVG